VQNFQILIVYAVKICKQCLLQLLEDSSPRPSTAGLRPDSLGYSRLPNENYWRRHWQLDRSRSLKVIDVGTDRK